jgi:hypothetical protein
MVGVDVFGRMGNQMFQYAFAYNTAKLLNTSFYIDDYTFPFCLGNYFRLSAYDKNLNRLKRKFFKTFHKKDKISTHSTFDVYNQSVDLKNNRKYWGYYQSELYFKDYLLEIKKQFEIIDYWKEHFQKQYANIFDQTKTIAIHIRRTDYVDQNIELPWSYYRHCLDLVQNLDDYQIFVIGDDYNYSKRMMRHYKNYTVCKNSEIVDFQIILNANIKIISNSTFAWWAAYLSEFNDKGVFAPKNWIGKTSEYPKGITSAKFNWIEVE